MRAIVAAHGPNYLIGKDGGLPWPHLKADMDFFRQLTTDAAVVMGRATWDSLPERFRPLPKRRNVVLSSNPDFRPEGALRAASMEEAKELTKNDEKVFYIGGHRVFKEALRFVDRMYLTSVYGAFEGETYFPPFDPRNWQKKELEHAVVEIRVRESDFSGRSLADLNADLVDNHERSPLVWWQYDRLAQPQAHLPNLGTHSNVLVGHSRSPAQAEVMQQIHERGPDYCPFCPQFFAQEHGQPIWKKGNHWYITPARWPYGEGSLRVHMMAIAIEHAERISDLPREARIELVDLAAWTEEEFGIESGALVMRFGKLGYNGSSVNHLHAHITCGDYDNPSFETVRFKIATLPPSS